jgi:hypothetical protein
MKYWVERWSELRKKELITYPDTFQVHKAYQASYNQEEMINGYQELYGVLLAIYNDIAQDAERMLLPVFEMSQYGYFSSEARQSRHASYKYAHLLYALGCSGSMKQGGELWIPVQELKERCKTLKITNLGAHLKLLSEYGFVIDGLLNWKIKSDTNYILVHYPDNKNMIYALYALAVKSKITDRLSDFCRMNYKLLADDWNTADFGNGADFVSDLLKSDQDKTIAQAIHNELLNRNYFCNTQEWNEGPQIRYYKNENDCKRNVNAKFWLTSMDTELLFYFRIACTKKVIEYISTCPESVIHTFMQSDSGCMKRESGCVSGISYQLNDQSIWRCGCCNPNFQAIPKEEDYIYYIKAAELA